MCFAKKSKDTTNFWSDQLTTIGLVTGLYSFRNYDRKTPSLCTVEQVFDSDAKFSEAEVTVAVRSVLPDGKIKGPRIEVHSRKADCNL